jgi:hypothetical protein
MGFQEVVAPRFLDARRMTVVDIISPVLLPSTEIIPLTTSYAAVRWLRNVRRNYDAICVCNQITSDTAQFTRYVSYYFLKKKSSRLLSVLVLHVIAKDAQVRSYVATRNSQTGHTELAVCGFRLREDRPVWQVSQSVGPYFIVLFNDVYNVEERNPVICLWFI